jgi:hypothetical protein
MAERQPTAAEAAELERLRKKLEKEGKVLPVDHEADKSGRTGPTSKK